MPVIPDRPREKLGHPFSIRLPASLQTQLDRIAKRKGYSRNAYIIEALRYVLGADEESENAKG